MIVRLWYIAVASATMLGATWALAAWLRGTI